MDVLYPAHNHTSFIVKIFFVCVHDDGSWKYSLEPSGGTKIALEFFGDSFSCILFDLFDHKRKELVPLGFTELVLSGNRQFLFTLVTDKCVPELLSIVGEVLREVEHDYQPHVVGGELDVSVVVVGVVESWKETVVELGIDSRMGRVVLVEEEGFRFGSP